MNCGDVFKRFAGLFSVWGMHGEPETEAEWGYREVVRVSDALGIPVMSCIQFFQWRCLESMGPVHALLTEGQEEGLWEALRAMRRAYTREWRVFYVSDRMIRCVLDEPEPEPGPGPGPVAGLESLVGYARDEGVRMLDVYERIQTVLARLRERDERGVGAARGVLQRYFRERLPWLVGGSQAEPAEAVEEELERE